MKLTFLGTSHGVPEKGRFCSSTLIETGGNSYIVDAGAPVLSLLTNYDVPVTSVKAVFMTHAHGDHVNGLVEFADLLTWYYKSADPLIFYSEEGLVEGLEGWLGVVHGGKLPRKLRYELEKPGRFYDDGILSVTAIPNNHMNMVRPAYSFLIEAEGKRIVMTGDLAAGMADFPKPAFEEMNDLVIVEGAHTHLDHHTDMYREVKTKFLGVTHTNPRANPPEAIKAIADAVDYPVKHFSDGDIFEL